MIERKQYGLLDDLTDAICQKEGELSYQALANYKQHNGCRVNVGCDPQVMPQK
jgi:hypothetical protein